MDTLKDKERATIKDIVTTFKTLNAKDREKLIWIGYGMSVAGNAKQENH